jgi:hypothetical protein
MANFETAGLVSFDLYVLIITHRCLVFATPTKGNEGAAARHQSAGLEQAECTVY